MTAQEREELALVKKDVQYLKQGQDETKQLLQKIDEKIDSLDNRYLTRLEAKAGGALLSILIALATILGINR